MGREASSSRLSPPPMSLSVSSPAAPTTAPTALAPGFRFHPTDEELVIYYLKRKVCRKSFRFNAITEVDVYKCEPWDLSGKSSLKSRDQEFYFFSALDRKYGNGARMNRATNQGYWKATGNDRPVRHNSRTVGLKKTLVFHSGRAPDGKRTNWVMHEYRIVDEELEKAGVGAAQDAFVLCRIFHKSNIGPPSGQRYAPFIEEEWDEDDCSVVVPGMDNLALVSKNPSSYSMGDKSGTYFERDCQEKTSNQETEPASKKVSPDSPEYHLSKDDSKILSLCKVERRDDDRVPCVVNREEKIEDRQNMPQSGDRLSSPLLIYKRRRHNDTTSSNCNASENSITQDRSSCVTTAATTMSTMTSAKPPTTRNFLSALVEYSLLETIEAKEGTPVPHDLDSGPALPPSCVKFIQDLQGEIHQVSIERDTLKFEMMSAQVMINILQSRIDGLTKELHEVKGKP